MDSDYFSELIDEVRPNLDAERQLKDLLVARARVLAERILGSDLVRRVSVTEVACSAAQSVLSDVKHGRQEPEGTRHLLAMLFRRTKAKTIEAIRRAKAAKRDLRQEVGSVDYVQAEDESPVTQAAIYEVAQEFATLICQERNDLRRCINHLGILGSFSARSIREALLKQEWVDKDAVPSIRTIGLWIMAERARIVDSLSENEHE